MIARAAYITESVNSHEEPLGRKLKSRSGDSRQIRALESW